MEELAPVRIEPLQVRKRGRLRKIVQLEAEPAPVQTVQIQARKRGRPRKVVRYYAQLFLTQKEKDDYALAE
jgi:hypothetical protein